MPITKKFNPATGIRSTIGMVNTRKKERVTHENDSDMEAFITSAESYEYIFPTRKTVLAGNYISEVKKVSTRTKDNKLILDVGYEITADDGETYNVLQSYPQNSSPLKKLFRAMRAAGLSVGDSPVKYIGVREKIVLGYPSEDSDFGSIVYREPLEFEEEVASEDDEFDDFLENDEY